MKTPLLKVEGATIEIALVQAADAISRKCYNAPRFIADKTAIAQELERTAFAADCGTVVDTASGTVWLVVDNIVPLDTWNVFNVSDQSQNQ